MRKLELIVKISNDIQNKISDIEHLQKIWYSSNDKILNHALLDRIVKLEIEKKKDGKQLQKAILEYDKLKHNRNARRNLILEGMGISS